MGFKVTSNLNHNGTLYEAGQIVSGEEFGESFNQLLADGVLADAGAVDANDPAPAQEPEQPDEADDADQPGDDEASEENADDAPLEPTPPASGDEGSSQPTTPEQPTQPPVATDSLSGQPTEAQVDETLASLGDLPASQKPSDDKPAK